MDLATLVIFRTVAAQQGVTRAAQLLGRAPSNVTTRIQQLEEHLGVALFHRERKRMILSDDGRLFMGYAERILNLADEARQRLNPAHPSGTLRVGSMDSTIAARLTTPLSEFARDWPDVDLHLTSGPTGDLLRSLHAQQIDCALVAILPNDDMAQDFELIEMFHEDLMLLLPADHPDVRGPADLRLHRLAAFAPGCSYRALAEEWMLADAGATIRVQEVPSYHAMYGCTVAGACISVMPRSVAALMAQHGTVRQVPLAPVVTYLACRKGFDTAAFDAFRTYLAQTKNL
ncbi:LysR family transcriptional regulator [Thioclava sp. SK-1]|uniref:LysR substrate-binding domain-containing protein n=1 Tax=Thioclava sp. SK-1 TaxID=1889770 RepID=UPI000824F6A6|nr:LysR substrate-binding domain-containing protein [Thioclava sp. SK-1]OCX66454.1 LysR family transcriptional regulator [Thioclava sp. SK-1]